MSESCNHNCSSCSENCSERKDSFLFQTNELSHIKKVYGIVSGKGGVGKSLVTSLLASRLMHEGYKVGIIDADITGPSICKMFGVKSKAEAIDENRILPASSKYGTKIIGINMFLNNEEDPVIWRGPVLASCLKQFYTDVVWNDIDFLLVDMPPGTADIPLTCFQSFPLDGIIVVTTPQDLVSFIVQKAFNMAKMMNVNVVGLVENMSYFECSNCHEKHYIYGKTETADIMKKFNVDVVSRIPITPSLAKYSDEGRIEEYKEEILTEIAQRIIEDSQDIVAIPYLNGEVFEHFGKTENFAIFEINKDSYREEIISAEGYSHHDLAILLRKYNVKKVLCGGIGQGAIDSLKDNNIKVYSNNHGDVKELIEEYIKGNVKENSAATCDEHHNSNESHNKKHFKLKKN